MSGPQINNPSPKGRAGRWTGDNTPSPPSASPHRLSEDTEQKNGSSNLGQGTDKQRSRLGGRGRARNKKPEQQLYVPRGRRDPGLGTPSNEGQRVGTSAIPHLDPSQFEDAPSSACKDPSSCIQENTPSPQPQGKSSSVENTRAMHKPDSKSRNPASKSKQGRAEMQVYVPKGRRKLNEKHSQGSMDHGIHNDSVNVIGSVDVNESGDGSIQQNQSKTQAAESCEEGVVEDWEMEYDNSQVSPSENAASPSQDAMSPSQDATPMAYSDFEAQTVNTHYSESNDVVAERAEPVRYQCSNATDLSDSENCVPQSTSLPEADMQSSSSASVPTVSQVKDALEFTSSQQECPPSKAACENEMGVNETVSCIDTFSACEYNNISNDLASSSLLHDSLSTQTVISPSTSSPQDDENLLNNTVIEQSSQESTLDHEITSANCEVGEKAVACNSSGYMESNNSEIVVPNTSETPTPCENHSSSSDRPGEQELMQEIEVSTSSEFVENSPTSTSSSLTVRDCNASAGDANAMGVTEKAAKTVQVVDYDNKKEKAGNQTLRVQSEGSDSFKVVMIEEDKEEEDSWDKMFDDSGDCLNPSAVEELSAHVGQVEISKPKKEKIINYLDYQPKEADVDMSAYGHVIEICDFPPDFQTRDLLAVFKDFMSRGFDIKWVDDTHALGVFSSYIAAQDALKLAHPMMKLKPLSEASSQSRSKARRCQEFLQPYKARPETSAVAARRLVSGALGLAAPRLSKEQREQERKALKEAKDKKKLDRKQKEDIWDGNT